VIIFVVLGFFGSVMTLAALIKSRDFTPHLLLVGSVSLSDIIVAVAALAYMTFVDSNLVQNCQIGGAFVQAGVINSIISFCFIILERYLVVRLLIDDRYARIGIITRGGLFWGSRQAGSFL
jgi:hypothetical protein